MLIIKPIVQSGRLFTTEDIMYAQHMVRRLHLPRSELADTLCDHWNWFTASGSPKNHYQQTWGDRQQTFWWVNTIEYAYGTNENKRLTLHLVVCQESWEEIDVDGQCITKKSKHAWISSEALKKENLHERCNRAARHRWGIETGLLKEKKQGYHYEHCFSKNWNAMMGYHYLMRIAHFLNELVQFSKTLAKKIKEKTVRGFIRFVFETCKGPWFKPDEIKNKLKSKYRYQFA